MPLLVVPVAPADEENADHLVEPDQRHRQVGAPHDPRRLQLQGALLEHLPVELHQRDGEPVLLLGRQGRQRRQPRVGPRLRLEQRALLVRHQLAEQLDGAGHARLRSLGRLEHLRDVAQRPAQDLAVGLAPPWRHHSFAFKGVGRPVRTPRSPLNGSPTSMPFAVKFILRTSVA